MLSGASTTSCPIPWTPPRMCEREDDDLFALDLIWDSEREAIQYGESTVRPMTPLRRCFRKPDDRVDDRIDFVFELDAARLVIVDLVIDLGDRESVNSNLQRRVRAALR